MLTTFAVSVVWKAILEKDGWGVWTIRLSFERRRRFRWGWFSSDRTLRRLLDPRSRPPRAGPPGWGSRSVHALLPRHVPSLFYLQRRRSKIFHIWPNEKVRKARVYEMKLCKVCIDHKLRCMEKINRSLLIFLVREFIVNHRMCINILFSVRFFTTGHSQKNRIDFVHSYQ